MRRAYAIRVLDSREDTWKVHMYWLNVQGLRVEAFVVCCLLFIVCCLMFVVWDIRAGVQYTSKKKERTHVTLTCGQPLGTLNK